MMGNVWMWGLQFLSILVVNVNQGRFLRGRTRVHPHKGLGVRKIDSTEIKLNKSDQIKTRHKMIIYV